MQRHVAVYARKSSDPQLTRISVDRQVAQCRQLAEGLWPEMSVEVYADPAVSGYDEDADRPEFDRLVHDARAGTVVHVVTSEQSRLTRRASQWDELGLVLSRSGIDTVHTLKSGAVSVVEGSRLPGRLLALVDEDEAERAKIRARAHHRQLAAEGRPGSGNKIYGYDFVRGEDGRGALEVNAKEAAVVRRIAAALVVGTAVAAIARDLSREQIPTPRGAPNWSAPSVKSVVSKPSVAGLRAYHGEIVGAARWDAILERDDWERVCAALGSPVVVASDGRERRVKRSRPRRPRRYLLTGGLARCGRCGSEMVAARSPRRHGPAVASYACSPSGGGEKACSGVSVSHADRVEAYVVDRVLDALDSPEFRRQLAARDGGEDRPVLVAQLSEAEERLRYGAELYGAGELDRSEFDVLRAAANEAVNEAREGLSVCESPAMFDATADDLRQRWEGLSLPERRSVLDLVLLEVRCLPANPGSRAFDGGRLELVWRA